MSDLQIFNFNNNQVRTLLINNEPYFVGKDVAEVLGYAKPRNAIAKHVDDEDKKDAPIQGDLGGKQSMTIINESGVYSLVFGSKLPEAKKFKHWVTSEVLPTIRKHGAYMTEKTLEEALTSPDFLIKLATELKQEQEKRKALEVRNSVLTVENQIMSPKADYFDELVDRNLLTNIRETAKELQVKEREFVNFLLDKKYLYRDKRGKLMPYAQKNDGLFELKECFNEGTSWKGTQTLVTPKGRETFRLLLK